jgi:hypothetical protein
MRDALQRRRLSMAAGLVVVVGLIITPAAPAEAAQLSVRAAPPACGPPVPSQTQPGYTVADPNCDLNGTPFVPLASPAGQPLSTVYTGILSGAAYRIEKPLRWNGELVVYAHGYRGQGTTVFVDDPALRAHYVSLGFAWAASSYQTNGYDVGQGVRDSQALIDLFGVRTGHRARDVYMTGASMGGHITGAAIEHFPRSFIGAMPYCGVLGDVELFDYFLDANVTAAALTHAPITFPSAPVPADFQQQYQRLVAGELPQLGTGFGTGGPVNLTALGKEWSNVVERRSGGERPGFDAAFAFWNAIPSIAPLNTVPFLFGVYPGLSGGTSNIASGNVTSNRFTLYQADDSPFLSAAERQLNRDVLRVSRTALPSRDLSGVPLVAGRPRVPVLSLHDIGDLFVPFSMEQVYARRAALQGRSNLFVSRAIRGLNHCDFTLSELAHGFDDLVSWVRTGHRPAGDDILNPAVVAKPTFGCRFTETNRPLFGSPCPASR